MNPHAESSWPKALGAALLLYVGAVFSTIVRPFIRRTDRKRGQV